MSAPAWKRNTQGDLKYKFPSFLADDAASASASARPPLPKRGSGSDNSSVEQPPSEPDNGHGGGAGRAASRAIVREPRRGGKRHFAAQEEMMAISDRGSAHSMNSVNSHPGSIGGASHDSSSSRRRQAQPHQQPTLALDAFADRSTDQHGVNEGRQHRRGSSSCCGGRVGRDELIGQVGSLTISKLEKLAHRQRFLEQKTDMIATQLADVTSTMDRIVGGQAEMARLFQQQKAERQLAAERQAHTWGGERPRSRGSVASSGGGGGMGAETYHRPPSHGSRGHHERDHPSRRPYPVPPAPGEISIPGEVEHETSHRQRASRGYEYSPRGDHAEAAPSHEHHHRHEPGGGGGAPAVFGGRTGMGGESDGGVHAGALVVYDAEAAEKKLSLWEEIERRADQGVEQAKQRSQALRVQVHTDG
jgi:hypothetical protein